VDVTTLVAHFGTFDVANYGDLLFPLIVERRLAGAVDEVLHVSPVGGPSITADGRASLGLHDLDGAALRAVIVGGGNIVSPGRSQLVPYHHDRVLAYPGLWLGAGALAARRDVPLVVNAPGVPRPLDPVSARLVGHLWAGASYAAVRDEASARRLVEAGVRPAPAVVPDTALDVAELWTEAELADARSRLLRRAGMAATTPTLAVHVKASMLTDYLDVVAGAIDALAESTGAVPVLLAVGPCHGDDRTARSVAARFRRPHVVVDQLTALVDVAGTIAGSVAYVGSSMHAMVTARALGTPGLLVTGPEAERDTKFRGFGEHVGWTHRIVGSWPEAAADRWWLHDDRQGRERLARARAELDAHWDAVRTALAAPRPPTTRRQRFLARPHVWPALMRGRDLLAQAQRSAGDRWPPAPPRRGR
jgi:polysaccharide pyruvyl transferase WcaK-like protein